MKTLLLALLVLFAIPSMAQTAITKDVNKMKQRLEEGKLNSEVTKAKVDAMLDSVRKANLKAQMNKDAENLARFVQENEKKKKQQAFRNLMIGGSMLAFLAVVLVARRKKKYV